MVDGTGLYISERSAGKLLKTTTDPQSLPDLASAKHFPFLGDDESRQKRRYEW